MERVLEPGSQRDSPEGPVVVSPPLQGDLPEEESSLWAHRRADLHPQTPGCIQAQRRQTASTSCPPSPSESPGPSKWPSVAYSPSRVPRVPVLLRHVGRWLEVTSPEPFLHRLWRTLRGRARRHQTRTKDPPGSKSSVPVKGSALPSRSGSVQSNVHTRAPCFPGAPAPGMAR